MVVDHKNGNPFDNRRENLCICTNTENTRRAGKQINNTSGKKGVCWDAHPVTPRWKAFIQVNRKYINLGYFSTFEEAVAVRVAAEQKYFGEFQPIEHIDIDEIGLPKIIEG